MKNYKSIRNFYEAMQQKPHHEQRNPRPRREQPKHEAELSFKKVIEFFKGIKP